MAKEFELRQVYFTGPDESESIPLHAEGGAPDTIGIYYRDNKDEPPLLNHVKDLSKEELRGLKWALGMAKPEKIYVLLGEDAIYYYDHNEMEEVKRLVRTQSCDVAEFDPSTSDDPFIEFGKLVDGWFGFISITEEEYNTIKNHSHDNNN
jgi:hypothetical protein